MRKRQHSQILLHKFTIHYITKLPREQSSSFHQFIAEHIAIKPLIKINKTQAISNINTHKITQTHRDTTTISVWHHLSKFSLGKLPIENFPRLTLHSRPTSNWKFSPLIYDHRIGKSKMDTLRSRERLHYKIKHQWKPRGRIPFYKSRCAHTVCSIPSIPFFFCFNFKLIFFHTSVVLSRWRRNRVLLVITPFAGLSVKFTRFFSSPPYRRGSRSTLWVFVDFSA